MSISSMASVAFASRADVDVPSVAPANSAPKSLSQIELATAGTPDSQTAVTTALKVIVTYIPAEVLTLYVAVLAAIQEPNKVSYPPLWRTFYSFLIATPIVVWVVYAAKCKAGGKSLPFRPELALMGDVRRDAGLFGVAFALPQSPFQQFTDWYSAALAGVIVFIISTVLGLIAPLFQRPIPS